MKLYKILLFSLIIFACKKEEEAQIIEPEKFSIIGKWEVTDSWLKTTTGDTTEYPNKLGDIYEFGENGFYVEHNYGYSTDTGSYILRNDSIFLTRSTSQTNKYDLVKHSIKKISFESLKPDLATWALQLEKIN